MGWAGEGWWRKVTAGVGEGVREGGGVLIELDFSSVLYMKEQRPLMYSTLIVKQLKEDFSSDL